VVISLLLSSAPAQSRTIQVRTDKNISSISEM